MFVVNVTRDDTGRWVAAVELDDGTTLTQTYDTQGDVTNNFGQYIAEHTNNAGGIVVGYNFRETD